MLKCTNEPQPFYESIGFKLVTKKSKWLKIPDVKPHCHEIKATKSSHCYILQSKYDKFYSHFGNQFTVHVHSNW